MAAYEVIYLTKKDSKWFGNRQHNIFFVYTLSHSLAYGAWNRKLVVKDLVFYEFSLSGYSFCDEMPENCQNTSSVFSSFSASGEKYL
jgi:hypothetical protein